MIPPGGEISECHPQRKYYMQLRKNERRRRLPQILDINNMAAFPNYSGVPEAQYIEYISG